MIIELKRFGDILTSREAGREALLAFSPTLRSIQPGEEIIIDFQEVSVLTPSWADEFIRPILFLKKYSEKVDVINDDNPSVQAALRFANPQLDLAKITVFQDVIVFDEAENDKNIYATEGVKFMPTFPCSDEEALLILKNHNVKKIIIDCKEELGDVRLKAVVDMLEQAGIKAVIGK